MVRTQIQLTEEQYQQLKELSETSQQSVAALIRGAVDQLLLTQKPNRQALYRQAETIVGKFHSGCRYISAEHDRYLDDAFSA